MTASVRSVEVTEARWWVTETMVMTLIGQCQARRDAPLAVDELVEEVRRMLPPRASLAERELVLPQVIGRLRDLVDAGKLVASADYSRVLGSGRS